MADYYTYACFSIGDCSDDEFTWLCDVINHNAELTEDESLDSEIDPPMPEGGVVLEGAREVSLGLEMGRDMDEVYFEDADGWFSAGAMIDLLQAFLKKFRGRREAIGFDWANGCSKHRLDAFGGGAAVVTADDYQIINTGSWIESTKKLMREVDDDSDRG